MKTWGAAAGMLALLGLASSFSCGSGSIVLHPVIQRDAGAADAGAGGLDGGAEADAGPDSGCQASALPTDTLYSTRAQAALGFLAGRLVPNDAYGDANRCFHLERDAYGLVARLELDRLGLAGGADAAAAQPWAANIAEHLARLMGADGAEAGCTWARAGSPLPGQGAAALAYALLRYGSGWSSTTKEAIRHAVQDGNWAHSPGPINLANLEVDVMASKLLVGEALGLEDLFSAGKVHLEQMVAATAKQGGTEMNSPIYTAEHFPALAFLQSIETDPPVRNWARILLDFELLVTAHLYQAGGALGAPQSRDYVGGSGDPGDPGLSTDGGYTPTMLPVIWLLTGEASLERLRTLGDGYSILAATEYRMPEVLRSIFLDKGAGYSFWTYAPQHHNPARTPEVVFYLGLDGGRVTPWQQVVLPGGDASIGLSYGVQNFFDIYVSSGTYARIPGGGFAILHQYQPFEAADTDDLGNTLGPGHEGYDFQRLMYGRTAVSLWDPTLQNKDPAANVKRTSQETRVHLPDYAKLGGEATTAGNWRVGKLGDAYVAYLPLGSLVEETPKDDWIYLRLAGRSGGVTEIASTSEFPTLADYARDLASRAVTFTDTPLAVEVDARDPVSGDKVRLRLEHHPARRVIAGREVTVEEALGHGLIESPWAQWDSASQRLTVSRECYEGVTYQWKAGTVSSP